MKRLVILLIIFSLVFPTVAYAEKHYGPLWAVWTHSEDPAECMAKTTFWIALVTFGSSYLLKRVTEKKSVKYDYTERNWTPTVWVEQIDKNEKPCPMFGIKVTW